MNLLQKSSALQVVDLVGTAGAVFGIGSAIGSDG